MNNVVVYILAKQNIEAFSENVELGMAADIYCDDSSIQAKVASMKIHRFKHGHEPRVVVNMIDVIKQISGMCPGVTVESIGETEIIIERSSLAKEKENEKNSLWEYVKIVFVSLICFFGTAFTIMAFHNDIGIENVFNHIYRLVSGIDSNGFTELEISYSVGLTVGIILFYNHVGKWKLSNDPTPLEVEMRVYERDVNQAIIDMAERSKNKQKP